MREILFRGKEKQNKNWVYGSFVSLLSKDTKQDVGGIKDDTIYRQVHLCELETVGQYTGLTDKNGTKIFEGDIVKNEYEENKYQNLKIAYKEKLYAWVIISNCGRLGMLHNLIGNIEVIGNIYDNPELLNEV